MGAPKGNRFWEVRSSHGRKPIFATPEELWDAACQYFVWVEDNPLYETKAFAFQGEVTTAELPKMRAMTVKGMCLYLGIGIQTFTDYESREGFSCIVEDIKDVIYQQKFTGAAADLLNSNIISRELGLADHQEISSKESLTPWDMITIGVAQTADDEE